MDGKEVNDIKETLEKDNIGKNEDKQEQPKYINKDYTYIW